MPLHYTEPSLAELRLLEMRYDGPIPRQHLEPRPALPSTRQGCQDLLDELGCEADELRAGGIMNDAKVAVKMREMELVRQHSATLQETGTI